MWAWQPLGVLFLPGLDPLPDIFLPPGDHQAGEFARGGVDGRILPGEAGAVPGAADELASPCAHRTHAQPLPDRADRLGRPTRQDLAAADPGPGAPPSHES